MNLPGRQDGLLVGPTADPERESALAACHEGLALDELQPAVSADPDELEAHEDLAAMQLVA